MLESTPPHAVKSTRDKLVALLDYVEQVVRLDERVAFDIGDYKLADGKAVSFRSTDTRALPSVRHDGHDDDGPIWLAIERLQRLEPPLPPVHLSGWIIVSNDPNKPPLVVRERRIPVDNAGRLARVAAGACADAFLPADPKPQEDDGHQPEPSYLFVLKLDDLQATEAEIERWIATVWTSWSEAEKPRRRTIVLYERLYKLLQQMEVSGSEAAIEIVWGIGTVHWHHAGRRVERPFIERRVDLELDDAASGLLRVRPTTGDATVDLKPYEDLGCPNLAQLDEVVRREIARVAADEGMSPFRRETFEPLLIAAAARLHADGVYLADEDQAIGPAGQAPTIEAGWVLFARPRTNHVVLADIDRLRVVARDPDHSIEGVSTRIVTEPSATTSDDWAPLSGILGDSPLPETADEPVGIATEVFFPKPFNDDQIEIVRRLAASDGLVVQGPPGTGKTHTIANLICHAMATGQRVLVVSRGEAALSVLRDQLPDKVRPLAIAILANERQGLQQVEGAIREIQSIVEESRPDVRRRAIAMAESEIVKLRQRIAAIDVDLDRIASVQALRIGPRQETPADLARRIASEREAYAWFTDRPIAYASETVLRDTDLRDLSGARRRVADLIDHRSAVLPSPADLPNADEVAGWHAMLLRGGELAETAAQGPARGMRLGMSDIASAEHLADALDGLARSREALPLDHWLHPFLLGRGVGASGPWFDLFAKLCADWLDCDAARARIATHAVDLPPGLLDDAEARAAIARVVRGDRLWSMFSIGKAQAKALIASIRLRGSPIKEDDETGWRFVEARIELALHARDLDARWRAFAADVGAGPSDGATLPTAARAMQHLKQARDAFRNLPGLPSTAPAFDAIAADPAQARALAAQLRQAIEAVRLETIRSTAVRIAALFDEGEERTTVMARRFFADVLGRESVDATRIGPAWRSLLARLTHLHERASDFATINRVTTGVMEAGAPLWAARLRDEPARADADPLISMAWRETWDFAAADAHLARIDARAQLMSLANQRAEHERNCARLFVELVRERTFYTLERRLSPSVKSALVEFVRALGRLGKGTGKGAGRQRRAAQDAMRRCYNAVPCWIMPTWRVAEQIPSDLAAFDLVILDEASQSDVTELPAILRGKKILVVGDDRQVSPMAPFVSQGRIDQLRQRYLRGLPFQSLLEPGESLYTLMQAVFPNERLMLKEHFRCVEPIIRFSMQFYPETLLPLRIPAATERLDPPLIAIYVPHGTREKSRKINRAEADVIVDEIVALTATKGMERRTIGMISLIGGDQADLVRSLLSDRLGAELMQRHAILCGDSATFQGNERDIMFLSMVADRTHRTALTMRRYEQRFNVAMSRARDRVVLVHSVERADLNPADLKARLLAHFDDPMPLGAARHIGDPLDRCESGFERDVMSRLLDLGYHVEPQVGALGFRIDMVVEGEGGRRLAVECDGDSFHGPERWREDMRRQRILERVGWRFWRCFASSFYADPDGTLADLTAALARYGIEPRPVGQERAGHSAFVERRIATVPATAADASAQAELPLAQPENDVLTNSALQRTAGLNDRIVLTFADDKKPRSLLLTDGPEDVGRGLIFIDSPLGRILAGREEDDEIELMLDGAIRKAMVERIEAASHIGAAE
ncbi:AAA domain-containing protein [Lichenihabitans psoromatis]|uniref:AAA domain-containing protein n=1 Tax=Lichenihabitans psoromatis TaxID=2528642 RepID=UPI0010385D48|nr:AAA domain-containing protein [Lichenihabitans psoromatis]